MSNQCSINNTQILSFERKKRRIRERKVSENGDFSCSCIATATDSQHFRVTPSYLLTGRLRREGGGEKTEVYYIELRPL